MVNDNILELDPSDERDCYWDVENDAIASAAWTSSVISPSGATALTLGAPANTTTRTTCRISAIQAGAKHYVKVLITLASGQKIARSRMVYGARQ